MCKETGMETELIMGRGQSMNEKFIKIGAQNINKKYIKKIEDQINI